MNHKISFDLGDADPRDVICLINEVLDEENLPCSQEVRVALENINSGLYDGIDAYTKRTNN